MSMKEETAEILQTLKHRASTHGFYALAISETLLEGTRILDAGDDWKLIHHNCKGKEGEHRGVGILLSPPAAEAWARAGSRVEVDDIGRAMKATIKAAGKDKEWHILSVYAPISKAQKGDVQQFYRGVSKLLRNIPDQKFLWMSGDFNSRLETRKEEGQNSIMGQFGLEGSNRNHMMDRLILFCHTEGLRINNTFCRSTLRKTATWFHPRWKTPGTLDLS